MPCLRLVSHCVLSPNKDDDLPDWAIDTGLLLLRLRKCINEAVFHMKEVSENKNLFDKKITSIKF